MWFVRRRKEMKKNAAESKNRFRFSKWSIYAIGGCGGYRHPTLTRLYHNTIVYAGGWGGGGTRQRGFRTLITSFQNILHALLHCRLWMAVNCMTPRYQNGINWSTNYLHGRFSCKIQQCHLWQTDKRADSTLADWLIDWLKVYSVGDNNIPIRQIQQKNA